MRDEMLELMRIMANGIVADEATADMLVATAESIKFDGHLDKAQGLRVLARGHRIEALKLQARLGALREQYAMLFHDGLWTNP